MSITEDKLRRIQQRKQAQLGLDAGDLRAATGAPKSVTVPCGLCGKPITLSHIPRRFGVIPSSLAHDECFQAEELRREQEQREAAQRQRQAEVEAIRSDPQTALARCGVPKHWLIASFDLCTDLPDALMITAQGWAERPDGLLYLCGIPGSGKTWLAVAILRHVLEEGVFPPSTCRYMAEREYLDGLRAAFNPDAPPVSPRLLPDSHPRRARLLIYDDLAADRQTDWARGEIARLIEARHAICLPTIITSNVALSGVAQAVDGRIASRIAESRMMLEFPKHDLRINGTVRPDNIG